MFALLPPVYGTDSIRYAAYALSLSGRDILPAKEMAFIAPGYPLFLLLSGLTVLQSPWPALAVQTAMGAAIPVLAYRALAPVHPKMAFYAGLGLVASLLPYLYQTSLITEQVYFFFLFLSVRYMALALLEEKAWGFLPAFLFLALVALTRPSERLLVVPFFLVAAAWRPRGLPWILGGIAVFVVCSASAGLLESGVSRGKPRSEGLGKVLFWNTYLGQTDHLFSLGISYADTPGPASQKLVRLAGKLIDSGWVEKNSRLDSFNSPCPGKPLCKEFFLDRYKNNPDGLKKALFQDPSQAYMKLLFRGMDDLIGQDRADKLFRGAAMEWIKTHPGIYFKIIFSHLQHFTVLPPRISTSAIEPQLRWVTTSHSILVMQPPGLLSNELPPQLRENAAKDPFGRIMAMPRLLVNELWAMAYVALRPLLFLLTLGALWFTRLRGPGAPVVWLCALISLYTALVLCILNEPIGRYVTHVMPFELMAAAICLWRVTERIQHNPGNPRQT